MREEEDTREERRERWGWRRKGEKEREKEEEMLTSRWSFKRTDPDQHWQLFKLPFKWFKWKELDGNAVV